MVFFSSFNILKIVNVQSLSRKSNFWTSSAQLLLIYIYLFYLVFIYLQFFVCAHNTSLCVSYLLLTFGHFEQYYVEILELIFFSLLMICYFAICRIIACLINNFSDIIL